MRFLIISLRTIFLGPLAVLAGCTDGLGVPTQIPTADVATGIYSLAIVANEDTCTPARDVGDLGEWTMTNSASTLVIDVPHRSGASGPGVGESVSIDHLGLPAKDGYSLVLRSTDFPGATSPCEQGNSFVIRYQVVSSTATRVEVSALEQWNVSVSCGPDDRLGGRTPPTASCTADRTFVYSLSQACAPPCQMKAAWGVPPASLQFICTCS